MTMRLSALLLVLWLSAHGDTLILRNGSRVTGRWWATDADVISFLVNNHLERYTRLEVREVVFGSEPDASAVAAPAAAPATAAPRASSTPPLTPVAAQSNHIGAIYFQENSGNLLALERAEGASHRG